MPGYGGPASFPAVPVRQPVGEHRQGRTYECGAPYWRGAWSCWAVPHRQPGCPSRSGEREAPCVEPGWCRGRIRVAPGNFIRRASGKGDSERVVHAAGPIGRRNPPPTFLRRKDKREPCLCRIDTHGTGAPIHMEKLRPPCKHKEKKKNSTNRPSSVKRYIS